MSKSNFEIIEESIKEYKELGFLLSELQDKLEETADALKLERKNGVSVRGVNPKITSLNEEREELKEKIKNTKKRIKEVFNSTEELIFAGIKGKYSEIYERQLSRLYGYKVDVIVIESGETYDEKTSLATAFIVTKNKSQHGKVVKMVDFGIRNSRTFYTEKKATVEVCVFSKKHKAGELLPVDKELLK